MKKSVSILVLSILILYILLCPESAITAASHGLVLWYTKMLPTLLPFSILSYICVTSGILNSFTSLLHRGIRWLLPISSAAVYPLFAGFLFGFPLGSHITALQVEHGHMEYREGNKLFSICNNIGPVFISGFILNTSLNRPDLKVLTLGLLYLPPLVYYVLDTRFHLFHRKDLHKKVSCSNTKPLTSAFDTITKKAAPRSQINFKIIDAGIMSGFETLTKLGGYIMLFAILSEMVSQIPFANELAVCLLVGLTEITNGIAYISASTLSFEVKYMLVILCTAFGGLSGLAQTASMTKEAGFSMGSYLAVKLVCSLTSTVLAYLAIHMLL